MEKAALYLEAVKRSWSADDLISQQIVASTQQVGTIKVQLASLNSGNIQLGQSTEGSNTFQRIVFSRSGAAGVDLVQVDGNVQERQPILSAKIRVF